MFQLLVFGKERVLRIFKLELKYHHLKSQREGVRLVLGNDVKYVILSKQQTISKLSLKIKSTLLEK